jgi:two-component system sensor histidine kinase PilS (NtrC family)
VASTPDARAATEAAIVRARVSWLVAGRVIISTALLGSATLLQFTAPGIFPVDPFFFLIGLTYGLSVAYLVMLRYVGRHPWVVDVQIWLDAILVSAFILVTGGIRSDFPSLYVLPIIAASLVRARRGALQVAALSACGYVSIVASQYVSVQDFPQWIARDPSLPAVRFAQYVLVTNVSGFFGVALLAGSLADRLQSTGAQLVDASAAIDDLRQFNAHVIDSLVSGLVTTDADWRVVTFNKAAATITGLGPALAVGRDVREVLALPPAFGASLAGPDEPRGRRADFSYDRPDGRTIELGVTAAPLPFPDGRLGLLFTFQDVTDVKRLERDAGRRDRLAAVGEMAAGIAHEIRNPLASMSGSIQVLREELSLTDEQSELMDIVLRESDRLNQTIRSFLAYARPKRVTLGRCDLAQVVRDTARLLQNGAEVRPDHRVEVDLPPAPVWCETDENQVRQILWNLATNGLRSMSTGGRLRVIVREGAGAPGDVEIVVADEGCGILPADLEHIFEPFHSTFERGTGLGLATVHRIVTELGGVIQVSSTVGRGTTMCVRLPRVAAGHAFAAAALQEAV